MELSKIQISKLDGNNWVQWKYRITALLSGMDGLMDIVEGKLCKPEKPVVSGGGESATAATEMARYNKDLGEYLKLESTALLLITNNITDEALDKIIRFTNPKDVWDELHRLYDGVNDDRLYNACMELFQLQMNISDNMATHISKAKNSWHKLNQELIKADEGKELPEILLICKILDTLPEEYFSFKSSWLMMSKKDRTVDNLTSQLCAHERALATTSKEDNGCVSRSAGEALLVNSKKKIIKKQTKTFKCHCCGEIGHFKKDCPKKERSEKNVMTNMMALLANVTDCKTDRDKWYVDNGATHHVTMRNDLYQKFERFQEPHTVITADGKEIEALGKGSILMKTKKRTFVMNDVWHVPKVKKNLFSVLSAHDVNSESLFESRGTTICSFSINGKLCVTGSRQKQGGLYELNCRPVEPKKSMVVNAVDTLQLYHERMGHQDKRHVKRVIERELDVKSKDRGILCEGCIFGKTHRRNFGVREKAVSPGERIHSDVCGPFPLSCSKSRYFVLFKDEFSRYRYVYIMKNKSEVPE